MQMAQRKKDDQSKDLQLTSSWRSRHHRQENAISTCLWYRHRQLPTSTEDPARPHSEAVDIWNEHTKDRSGRQHRRNK